MNKHLLACLSFVFMCSAGLFCSWIGGIRPFTDAGGTSALVILIAATASAMAVLVGHDGPGTDPYGE